jgi:hypothetical protein
MISCAFHQFLIASCKLFEAHIKYVKNQASIHVLAVNVQTFALNFSKKLGFLSNPKMCSSANQVALNNQNKNQFVHNSNIFFLKISLFMSLSSIQIQAFHPQSIENNS